MAAAGCEERPSASEVDPHHPPAFGGDGAGTRNQREETGPGCRPRASGVPGRPPGHTPNRVDSWVRRRVTGQPASVAGMGRVGLAGPPWTPSRTVFPRSIDEPREQLLVIAEHDRPRDDLRGRVQCVQAGDALAAHEQQSEDSGGRSRRQLERGEGHRYRVWLRRTARPPVAAAAATVAAVAPITSTSTMLDGDTVASMASSTSCGGVTPSS